MKNSTMTKLQHKCKHYQKTNEKCVNEGTCCCHSIKKKQTSSKSALPAYHVYSNEVYLKWNPALPHNHIFFFKQCCEQLSARTQASEQTVFGGAPGEEGEEVWMISKTTL